MINTYKPPKLKTKESLWTRKKSYALTLAIASACATQAFAQDEADEGIQEEELVVTGMRAQLQSAQELKRNAATVVDSITAKELGSFPDKSVAEALQRVAGVTVNRFAASSDTAHFSAEPSGVVVRGLNQVRTEFNGRDSFSANSSRGLSWGDVSPELMSGVDTYKNQMAELIEGGIAGTVNMKTRVPFDQDGQLIAGSISANYGDLSEEVTPEGSILYSNRWEVGSGEIGFLINIAHSEVETRSQGNQLYRINRFRGIYDINGDGDVGADELGYIPAQIFMRDNLYERTRDGIALAFQYQNSDESLVVTTQYNRSEYENAWEEYVVAVSPSDHSYGQSVFYEVPDGESLARPVIGVDGAEDAPAFTFDERGLFQYGTAARTNGWWGNPDPAAGDWAGYRTQNTAGDPFVAPCYDWAGCAPDQRGIDIFTETRVANTENMTQDLGVNVKWSITDTVRANFDVQYVESTVDNYDVTASFNSFANTTIDLRGDRPAIDLLQPTNVNMSEGNWSNPNNYYLRYVMDHLEESDGDQISAKMDFEFDIDNGPLQSIKVGARYADRAQTIRWSDYNWQNYANTWTENQAHYFNLDRHEATPGGTNGNQPNFTGYPTDLYAVRDFGSDFHDINITEFVFANADLLADQERMASSMSATALGLENGVGWDPICSNVGDRASEIPGTCTTPAELVDVEEKTTAAYVQLNFGDAELFGMPYSGNIGFRWVKTQNTSRGGVDFPLFDAETLDDEPRFEQAAPGDPQVPAAVPFEYGYYLSADDIAFAQGVSRVDSASETHYHILPSFNFKLDLTDEWVTRIALSRAMSRPDMGNLRNYISIGDTLPSYDEPENPQWTRDANGDINGIDVFYSGSAQNPGLAPVIADQADLSLEYYFADVGSFTMTAFYKDFDDYIQIGTTNQDYTVNGVTRSVEVRRPLNGEGASLKGFELAFQTFFTKLPEPFDGLGIQANYTYIDNSGIGNTNITNTGTSGDTITDQAPDAISVDRLEGLSDHSYNIIGMFEKGDWKARLAYSWRDEYMVTAIDCCVSYPIWNDDYGQVDGSISYSINDMLDISLQGSNLTNSETKLEQQIENAENGGLRMPNSTFQNDRRYTLSVRFKY